MTQPSPVLIKKPKKYRAPLLVSVPHAGTYIPQEIAQYLKSSILSELKDTDWLVGELYDFAPDLGITVIQANYSRYVVDLNRPSHGPALYQDARLQTDVIPLTNFDGEGLYSAHWFLSDEERSRRLKLYYEPYYQALRDEIKSLQDEFDEVILFDAHSIRRNVPTIQQESFPDLIVGDRDGTSTKSDLAVNVCKFLTESSFNFSYNRPFKGGHITRTFGQPARGINAIQLEMSQDLYLLADRSALDPIKCGPLRELLKQLLLILVSSLGLKDASSKI